MYGTWAFFGLKFVASDLFLEVKFSETYSDKKLYGAQRLKMASLGLRAFWCTVYGFRDLGIWVAQVPSQVSL